MQKGLVRSDHIYWSRWPTEAKCIFPPLVVPGDQHPTHPMNRENKRLHFCEYWLFLPIPKHNRQSIISSAESLKTASFLSILMLAHPNKASSLLGFSSGSPCFSSRLFTFFSVIPMRMTEWIYYSANQRKQSRFMFSIKANRVKTDKDP